MTLAEYLARPRPAWDWITHDCSRWIDNWIVARGNPSPMQAIGIQYDSELSAMRRIAEGGGLAALWTLGMIQAGVPEVDEPQAGDVGVIASATDDGAGEACGIYTGTRWLTFTLRGIEAGPATVIRAWRP